MSEKPLKFNNIILNKKKFHRSEEPIDLLSVDSDQIFVSHKFKHNDEGFKYFISYLKGKIIKPLCIILPQMSRYIKYFENGSKNMSFFIKDDEVGDKYDKIWDVIKDKLNIKFHSEPANEYKYLKTKVREYNGEIKTNFLNNGIPKENIHYSCIACITIDSVINFNKKNHLQVYLEECKYKIKKRQMPKFIKNELKSDSESDSNDKELLAKLKDSDSNYDSDSEVESESSAKKASF